MSAPWPHVHVSEREVAHTWPDGQRDDSHWEDCLWCSVVEWLNDTYKDVPDTLAYAERLRDASGEPPSGGSNFSDVQRAFAKLGIPIDLDPRSYSGFTSRLKPGTAGVATGNMGNFPRGHRLRRWDPDFAAGHAVEVSRDAAGQLWWCDPLAPKGTYQGERITESELKTFMGSGWTGVVRQVRAKPATPAEEASVELSTYTPGATANVKPSSNVRSEPKISATKYHTTTTKMPVQVIGTCKGDVDPANGSNVWYVLWHDNRLEYTAKDNVVDLKPAASADCSAAVDAAVKAQITKDAAAQAAAVTKAKADATVAERDRIAAAEAARIKAI